MENEAYNYLTSKFGKDLVIEHICPFVYQKQDPLLLLDIRTYSHDKWILNSSYNEIRYPIDERIYLFYDLISYSTSCDLKNNKRIKSIVKTQNPYNQFKNINSVNNQIIASLTPYERTHFINHFILKHYITDSENEDEETWENEL